MPRNSLLLDSDIVIHLHEAEYWNAVMAHYALCVGSVVAGEVEYYRVQGNKIAIDLQGYIRKEEIVSLSATAEELANIFSLLPPELNGIDAGESECLAIIHANKTSNLTLCLKDGLPIKAISYLGLEDKAVSL